MQTEKKGAIATALAAVGAGLLGAVVFGVIGYGLGLLMFAFARNQTDSGLGGLVAVALGTLSGAALGLVVGIGAGMALRRGHRPTLGAIGVTLVVWFGFLVVTYAFGRLLFSFNVEDAGAVFVYLGGTLFAPVVVGWSILARSSRARA